MGPLFYYKYKGTLEYTLKIKFLEFKKQNTCSDWSESCGSPVIES